MWKINNDMFGCIRNWLPINNHNFCIVKYWPSRGSEYLDSKYLGCRTSSDITASVCRTRACVWHFTSIGLRCENPVLFYPNTMAAWDLFWRLASLVIIFETLCCQSFKLNCRVVLGTPTRICVTIAAAIPGTITNANNAI